MPGLPKPITVADAGPRRAAGARAAGRSGPRAGGHRSARPPGGRLRRGETIAGWAFIAPAVVVIIGLAIVPVGWSLLLSFQANDLVTPGHWVGLANYEALVTDPAFGQAVRNTLVYTALYVPLSVALGLALALALNRRIRLVGLYRVLFFVPFVISATVQGTLFAFVLDPQFGAANSVLHALGLEPQGFLTDPNQALLSLVGITLWSGTGFCVVVYLAALQDVPVSLVEAARLDGAGPWRLLWHITLPTLRPVTVFLVLWQLITSLQVFDLVYVTTKGGPLGATTVIVYFIWEQAFKNFTAGYGAAAAYVLAVALLTIAIAQRLVRRRQEALENRLAAGRIGGSGGGPEPVTGGRS